MANPNIKVGYDVSDAEKASADFVALLQAQHSALTKFTVKMVEFNDKGELFKATVEQITQSGEKLQTVFAANGQALDKVSQKFTSAADAAKKLAAANAAAAQVQLSGAANAAFPAPSTTNINAILAYNNALAKVGQVANANGVSVQQLNSLLAQASQNMASFTTRISSLPTQLQATATAIAQLGVASAQAGESGKRGGEQFAISWQGLLRILEVQLFRRAITGIINATTAGVTAAIDYQIKLQQVANVGQQTGRSFTALSTEVRRLSDTFAIPATDILASAQKALSDQVGNTANAFTVLNAAAKLSIATGTELTTSTTLITASLDAFGLKATDAAHVSEVFFNLAKQTRVPLSELQNVIGRTGIVAQGLGLSFEQVGAAFLTIQNQGTRPVEAFSLLQGILGRLAQPSKEIQEIFRSMGTPTAELAIKTFGLNGVLDRLNVVAQATPERIGDIAGSITRLQGLMGLTGQQAFNFSSNLAALGQNSGLDEAATRVQQTSAQKLKVQFEQIKNIFREDIGNALIASVVKIVDALGGADVALTTLFSGIKVGVSAFISLRVTITTVNGVLSVYKAQQASAAAATLATATASNTAATSVGRLGAAFGVVTAAVSIGVTAGTFLVELERIANANIDKKFKAIADQFDRLTAARNTLNSQNGARDIANFGQGIDSAASPIRRLFAEQVQLANISREQVLQSQNGILDTFKTFAQTSLDRIRDSVREARKVADEAETDIKASQKRIANAPLESSARVFQTAAGLNQDPRAGLELNRQRAIQVNQEIRQLEEAGDKASIDAARQKFAELRQLDGERLRLETQSRTIQTQLDFQAGTAQTTLDSFGRRRLVVAVDLNQIRQRELEISRQQEAFEERQQARDVNSIGVARAVQTTETARLRNTELAFRRIEEFRLLNQGGTALASPAARQAELAGARPNDPTAGRLAGARVAFAELATLEANLRRQIGQSDEQGQRELTVSVRSIRLLAEQELQADLARIRAEANARNFENEVTNQRRIGEDALRRRQEAQTNVETDRSRANRSGTNLGAAFERQFGEGGNGVTEIIRDFQERLRRAQRPEDVARLQEDARQVRLRTTDSTTGQPTIDAARLPNVIANLNNLDTQLANLALSFRGLSQANTEVQNSGTFEQRLTEQANILPARFQTIGDGIQREGGNVVNNLAGLAIQIRDALVPRQGFETGGIVRRFAMGGPVGTDTIPAWLSPGEFIMPAAQTKKWSTQLESMRAGITPQYFSQGGAVNVGDINVNVTGGNTSEATVREIGRSLEREIRRGTIRLR